MRDLTWRCHVCGDERPDERISVFSRKKEMPSGMVLKENVRYCNDRPACEVGAHDVHWVSAPEDPQEGTA